MALNVVKGSAAVEGVQELLAVIADPAGAAAALAALIEAQADLEKERKALELQRAATLDTIKDTDIALAEVHNLKQALDARILVHDASLAQYEVDRRALNDLVAELQERESRLTVREQEVESRESGLSKATVELDDREAKVEVRETAAAHSRARMAEVLAEIK